MMIALFWQTIKDRKYTIIIYCLGAVLFLWMYIALYPAIQAKADEFSKLLSAYPESFMKAFNIGPSQLLFDNLQSYLAMEQFNFIWPIMLFAFFIGWGGSALAGEIEKGTAELLLSQPISRMKIFFGKYLAALKVMAIFTIISVFSVIPLAKLYHLDYQFSHYVSIAIVGFLFGCAVFSLAIFFSSVFSDKGKAYFVTTGILVLMYVLNIISNLQENLKNLQYLSFFHYYDPAKALVDNKIESPTYWVFLGVVAVFTLSGAIYFSQRDISN